MARIRTVKPEHWSDKQLALLSLPAHLLWIASWNFSDDEGIFENDPVLIKSNVFPRRTDVRVEQISQWLDQLVKARFIVPFEYKNESYFIHRTFKTHQRIDKPQASKIPETVIISLFQERSENVPRTFSSVEESIVEESKVKESRGRNRIEDFNLDFIQDSFIKTMIRYLDYRKKIKKPFKTQMGIEACYSNLLKLSQNDSEKAEAIVQQSIENEWQGLFEIKEKVAQKKLNHGEQQNRVTETINNVKDLLRR